MSNESDNLKIPRINSVKEFFAQALEFVPIRLVSKVLNAKVLTGMP